MKHLAILALVVGLLAGVATLGAENGPVSEAGPVPPKQPAPETVVIVYKTHFDIGYTSSAKEVVHDYRTEMTDRLLDAIEHNRQQPKDAQFVWTLSGYPMQQILWEGQPPERREKIEQAIRAGNIAIHGLACSLHTEAAGLEELVRGGLGISSRLCRQYGRPLSASAKMTDVPGQSWVFPTLFSHAGIKFYHMGGPVVNFSFNLPPAFWWEGPDGSRLLTLYNNGYGSSALPPDGWPYKTWLAINMTGDNQGPPPPATVQRDLAFYTQRGIKAQVGTMDDFAELILQEDLSQLPVVRTDIPDPWIHGVMSMPAAVKTGRNHQLLIGATDALTTLESQCWGVFRPDISTAVDTAYQRSLRFSEHTFGLANQHYVKQPYGPNGADWDRFWAEGLSPSYRRMEACWQEKAQCTEDVRRLVADPCADAILTLSDNVAVPGGRVVVYNPLPWPRSGEIVLNCFHLLAGSSLKPVDGGPAVPVAYDTPSIETNPSRVRRFVVHDIPPMGYRTFVFSDEKTDAPELTADAKTGVIASPFFQATLDPKRGRIASLVDKRSGRELVDADAPHGFGQYLYERFSYRQIADWLAKSLYGQYVAHRYLFAAYDMPQDSTYVSAVPESMTLTVEKTAIDVTAVMTGTLPAGAIGQEQRISIRLTLPASLPVADLTVSWQKQPDGWPEAGWICLPFKCGNPKSRSQHALWPVSDRATGPTEGLKSSGGDLRSSVSAGSGDPRRAQNAKPKFRLGRLGADLDPVQDITLDYVNYHNAFVDTGVAVYDGGTGAGVGLCPLDSPMVSLGEPGEYKFDKRYVPQQPYVYLNLYNNHWRTNFAAWIGRGERMESRVRLWAFDKFASESALYTPALEARLPLLAARSTTRPGKLPPTQAGIALSRKGVMVTAFGKNPDGPGTIFRVWEQGGVTGDLTVTLPRNLRTATPVTLRGEKTGEPLAIADSRLSFPLPAYAPASFVLE